MSDARDLIKGILQREPSKRLTIKQILSRAWFSSPQPVSSLPSSLGEKSIEEIVPPHGSIHTSMSSDASDSTYTTFHSAASDLSQSAPTTPDEPTSQEDELALLHLNLSQSTIKRLGLDADNTPRLSTPTKLGPETNNIATEESTPSSAPSGSNSGTAPPTLPTRTPARTKRRSVSSTLSTSSSPASPTHPNMQPPQDFVSTLTAPAPIVFSTPLERDLLNNLSALGFDTGQMVHSVLTNACDSSGALWWMMRKKAERRALEEAARKGDDKIDEALLALGTRTSLVYSESAEPELDTGGLKQHSVSHPTPAGLGISPDVGIVRPTPIPDSSPPMTPPPRVTSPVMLSPTPSQTELHQRSNLNSPSNHSGKGRVNKPRSASVSIMQRATTALEAAGLVRKKSDERFRREEQDKEREREKEKDNQKTKEREEKERRATSGDDSRASAIAHKLTKSPPSKPAKEGLPTTPELEPSSLAGLPSITSPWVNHTSASTSSQAAPTPANSPGDSGSVLPPSSSIGSAGGKQQGRARASILHTFRMWFNEDRKGKRKTPPSTHPHQLPHHHLPHPITTPNSAGSVRGGRTKRRSGSGSAPVRRGGHQKRPSASSRRSSSVNSRRSSITSIQKITIDYQHSEDHFNPRRRSFGAKTPTSERGDYPSRPSSIHSFQVTTPGVPPLRRRSHSPSESSTGSGRRSVRRTDSPLQRYHRRGGSGSSTRVVRQIKTVHPHVRSDSVASSHHSAPSSRPGSYHEGSEAEGPVRNGSPFGPSWQNDDTPRRAPYSTTVLVAHKKQTPFRQPSLTRSSWKKAWGVEPPGWKSRSTEAPFEVLFTDDPRTSVRDVFSGRPSLNLGDEDDWVDEDDDAPFAGGLGQMPISNSSHPPATTPLESYHKPEALVISPPPRSSSHQAAPSKRTGNRNSGRKASHSPVGSTSPVPQTIEHTQPESRGTRRQLPARAEPAFRQPIQEEDEDEEE